MKAKAEPLPLSPAEIPRKRYFAIGEVSEICGIKPHVLRYWEQEFPQLKPIKRRGNRRYYQFDDVEMVRRIRSLLYEQGFTIGGARQRLREARAERVEVAAASVAPLMPVAGPARPSPAAAAARKEKLHDIRTELEDLLKRWPV
ncbi:MerR family transcriptional regulator [Stagnimonas aquatica]|uniref:MerR family transcriptional regulator n=1 Tax=Stagnimonas aquatica TaxID=2689987 RepID=A0A3N0VEJ7_9GAMM|nr:MerR family transcriptional regulator [Stagnimonas aquatica]